VWKIGLFAAVGLLVHYVGLNTIALEYFPLSCREEIRGDRDRKTELTSMRILAANNNPCEPNYAN